MHLYAPTGTEDALRETNSVFPGFRDRLNKTVYPLVNVGGFVLKKMHYVSLLKRLNLYYKCWVCQNYHNQESFIEYQVFLQLKRRMSY